MGFYVLIAYFVDLDFTQSYNYNTYLQLTGVAKNDYLIH